MNVSVGEKITREWYETIRVVRVKTRNYASLFVFIKKRKNLLNYYNNERASFSLSSSRFHDNEESDLSRSK